MLSAPDMYAGWFATIPTELPSRRAKPTTASGANSGCRSMKLSWS